METLETPGTQNLDPLSTESSNPVISPLAENLAPWEYNAAANSPFFAGDFVWAEVKGCLWWPAIISTHYEAADSVQRKLDSVLVACFGDDNTLAWSEPKQLKPFLEVFDEMSRQSSSKSFLNALDECVEEVGRNLQLELTCHCVPLEDRPKTMRSVACGGLPVANYSPWEFLDCVLDVARDAHAVNVVEVLRLRSLVFAFGKFSIQGEDWAFHRRRGIEELVDKIDLDTLLLETVSGKEEAEVLVSENGIVKRPGLSTGMQQQCSRRRSMIKLIADMDLDTVEIDEEEEEQSFVWNKRKKGKLEEVKAEEEPCSGRRERKKSKYLSPPYTNFSEEGKFVDLLPMSLESKSSSRAACFFDPGATGFLTIVKCSNEEDENKSPLLKIEKMPAHDIFSEFVATAKNTLHLKRNRFAGVVKFFFTMFRSSMYSTGADFEKYQKLVLEFITEKEYAVGKAEKPKSSERNRKHGSYKGTDLDFKRRKRNKKHGSDRESKLYSEEPKVNSKYGTNQDNDMDSRQQKNESSEKHKPKRKKMLEGTNQVSPVNSGLHMVDISVDGKEKQKPGKNKVSKHNTSQGAPVDSNSHLANELDGGKKQQHSGKKKALNDGIYKEVPSHLNLNMVDASYQGKLVEGRKRSKIDAKGGAAAVNVDLEKRSKIDAKGGAAAVNVDLEKKMRVNKDVANVKNDFSLDVEPINCHNPASVDEKMIDIKEDVNGKSLHNSSEDVKLPGGGKSGRKKKNSTGPRKAKSRGRKGKKVVTSYSSQAALHLTFHSGVALPSIEDLITTYSKYGALIHSGIELLKESNTACVVFANSACAENAFKDKAGPYCSVATYRLHYLSKDLITYSQPNPNLASPSRRIPDVIPSPQIPDLKSAVYKPPLPYVRKSLEAMISNLARSSSLGNNAGSSSDGLKPEARDNLVCEMQGLLRKVDSMLNGPGSSSSH